MTNEQLEYVKSQLAAGVSPETIRTTLLQNGYSEVLIEELFTAAGVSISSIPATGFTPNTIQEYQTSQDTVSNQPYSTEPLGAGEFIGKSFSLAFSNIALFLPGFGILFILTLLTVFLSSGSP